MFLNKQFYYCDRSGAMTPPLKKWSFTKEQLTEDFVEGLFDLKRKDENTHDEFFKNIVKNYHFKEEEANITLSYQVIGNCARAALEGIVYTWLKEKSKEPDVKINTSYDADKIFERVKASEQINVLKRYFAEFTQDDISFPIPPEDFLRQIYIKIKSLSCSQDMEPEIRETLKTYMNHIACVDKSNERFYKFFG
jgi:hypothetical protein